MSVLKERQDSREALESMVKLIAEIADYIQNYKQTVVGEFSFCFIASHPQC